MRAVRAAQLVAALALLVAGAFEPPRIDFEQERLEIAWSAAGAVTAARETLPDTSDANAERAAADRPAGAGMRLTSHAGSGLVYTREGTLASDWSRFERISLWIRRSPERAAAGATQLELQMIEPGGGRFSRALVLDHSGWRRFELPLSRFAWQQTRLPRWDRIRHLGLYLRGADDLWVDELRVHDDPDGPGPFLTADEVCEVAFGAAVDAGEGHREERAVRVFAEHGIELISDAPKLDLAAVHGRLVAAARLIDPLLPPGGDPLRTPRLVVFADDADYRAFAPRLAEAFGRGADAPSSGGYTLLAIAHGAWSEEHGGERPTYVHEFVHSYLSCRALLPNRSEWLQEGLATHFQMHFHRQDDLDELVTNAASRLDDAGLIAAITSGEPIASNRYWLAMTLVQTLMERERYAAGFTDLIAAARRNGSTALAPLLAEVYDSNESELFEQWRAWVEVTYATGD